MACCVLTAYIMSRLIKACEFLDLDVIKIQYNDFDNGPEHAALNENNQDERIVTSKISVGGMTCTACVSSIEKAVSKIRGVERVSISLHLSRATVVHRKQTPLNDILTAIERRGYEAAIGERTAQQTLELLQYNDEIQEIRRAFTNAALLSSIISCLESLSSFQRSSYGIYTIRSITAVLAVWIQISDAKFVHSNAWRGWLALSLTMDTLVSLSLALGTASSMFNVVLFGLETPRVYWSSMSFLTTVVVGGRLLDLILRKQSSATFAELYKLQEKLIVVKIRRRKDNGALHEQYIDAALLQPGDEFEIGIASIIPCDCYVLDGNSLVDQSTMTGESVPISKGPGDCLMSGTQNLSHALVAVVHKAQEESALESLISSISTSTESATLDARTSSLLSWFVFLILALAILGFCMTWRIRASAGTSLGMAVNAACERAMAILASACPCALGLAAPSAVTAGLDACRLRGVVVRQGLATFQSMSSLTHVVLDKTGTLTTGKLSVKDVDGCFGEEHRTLICVAERESAQYHPVAQAVFQWSFSSLTEDRRRNIGQMKAFAKHGLAANGIEVGIQIGAGHDVSTVRAGSEQFMCDNGIDCSSSTIRCSDFGNQIVVHFAVDRLYIGRIHLHDTIREEAISVVAYLGRELHLDLSLLTGDTENEARRVSKTLGITTVASHSLPIEKKSFVERIKNQNPRHCVAMVGDGLNDSPALAVADIGIGLSMNGSNRASISESTNAQIADIIFTSPNLRRLPEALQIAQKTLTQANWNMYWAIGYNSTAVALAMGVAEPIGLKVDAAHAGTMMAMSSISVLVWSLWLRYDLSKVSFQDLK